VIRAALIDLDGTLLDTAPEIVAAGNAMLRELGRETLPEATVESYIGKGVVDLALRCLRATGGEPSAAHCEVALEIFDRHYTELNERGSAEYPGVRAGLEAMRDAGLRLACVTNKRGKFALPLLEATGLAPFFGAVVSGDSVRNKKPHPEPFLEACRQLGVAPADAVVIGDSANDADAARAAGCGFLLVPYGYREGREVQEIACDGIVDSLMDAASRIAARSRMTT
jgi:phosphoglycolate phosphatase